MISFQNVTLLQIRCRHNQPPLPLKNLLCNDSTKNFCKTLLVGIFSALLKMLHMQSSYRDLLSFDEVGPFINFVHFIFATFTTNHMQYNACSLVILLSLKSDYIFMRSIMYTYVHNSNRKRRLKKVKRTKKSKKN